MATHRIGGGWNIYNALVTAGDNTGEGNADIIARDTTGNLWLCPGDNAGGFGSPRQIGIGIW